MKKIKKLSLYELNPRYFKDSTGNGVGDLAGLANNFEYFDYLGVDGIILKDVISSDVESKFPKFTEVANDLGTLNDLKRVTEKAKKFKKGIFIELKIGSLKQNHQWIQRAIEDPTDEFEGIVELHKEKTNEELEYKRTVGKTREFYVVDSKTQEIPLNWRSENVINKFVEVIRFWKELGVNGFVFKDFEYVANVEKNNPMNEATLKELRKFYRAVKEINDNIVIIGKTDLLPMNSAKQYTFGATQVFDYFMTTETSLLGTDNNLTIDRIGKFKVKDLKKVLKTFGSETSNILSFGSERTGRILSRWGNDGQYSKESSKALGMALLLNKSSSSIYYGDEIGTPNIGLTHLDDFQDKTLETRRKNALGHKVDEKEFMDAQVLQNPINSRSLMAWNDNKNGGFSTAEKPITPASIWYKEVNVKFQYEDQDSSLQFFKALNKLITKSSYAKIFEKGEYKVSSLVSGVLQITFNHEDKQIRAYINLTDAVKPVFFNSKGKVILSNYSHKDYALLPKKLDAYEGVVVYFKEPKVVVKPTRVEITKTEEVEIIASDERQVEVAVKEELKNIEEKIDNNQIEEVINHDETHEVILEDDFNQEDSIEENIEVEEEFDAPVEENENTDETVIEVHDMEEDMIKPEENIIEPHIEVEDTSEELITFDETKEIEVEKNSLESLKEIAKIDRDIERSYLDEKTKLTEDEVAKTTLLDDTVDLDELFAEEINKKR